MFTRQPLCRPGNWAACLVFGIVACPLWTLNNNRAMSFKPLLDNWEAEKSPVKTSETYAVHLPVRDAARIKAFAELFDGVDVERVITDLLSAALDRTEAAIPYEPGGKVIREDEFGDPVYEDKGLTPRFLELVRKHQSTLEN